MTRATLTLNSSMRLRAVRLPSAAGSSAPRAGRAVRVARCQAAESSTSQAGSTVSFKIQQGVPFKTYFKVCGNIEALGAWDLDSAPAMEWSEGDIWSLDVTAPAGVDVEYKIVKIPRREPIAWESGPNRLLKVQDAGMILKLAFDDIHATEVIADGAEQTAAPEAPAVEVSAAEEVMETVGKVVAEEPAEKVADKVAEVIAEKEAEQGVQLEEIVEEIVEAAVEVAEAIEEAKEEGKAAAASSSSGATVAAASVVENLEEKSKEEKKSPVEGMLGGLFGRFGKK